MKLVLSLRAVVRLREIRSYIAYDDAVAAARVIERIRQSIEMLTDHPRLGRPWGDGRTRALTVSGLPYRIHYRLVEAEERIEVITVAHVAQRPPRLD
ncbi:MAG TPA: type II toxin-antitoxin system RelE/ParE family toxin [Thermohalobaculum sp.]|nr:type II toxin-antitoxin system RelE/ParE family toxin [Thermohalobaculum sp.]